MRILILASVEPPRGVLRSLANLGVEPVVARAGGTTESDGLIQFVRVSSRGDPQKPQDLRWSRRGLRALVRDVGPSLLHIVGDPWTPTAEVGAAAARDLKIPYVLVVASSRGGPRAMASRWQAERVRDGAAGVAGLVRPALDHVLDGPSSKVPTAILPPGGLSIPPAWVPRPDPERVAFATVGRLVPERGVDMVLEALGGIFGEWRLNIVGTGPVHEALERQAQQLGLSARISWLGAVPLERLDQLWSEVDVLVAPSRSTDSWTEPTGTVVLRAMAHGVAPLVSRCGALPDVVGDGGLIVNEGDVEALGRAMSAFITEPSRCRAVGAAARQRVLEQYSDAAVAERMVALWRKVLAA